MCLQQSKETQITTLLIELATHHFLLESTVYRCMLLDHYGDCLQVTCTLWYSTSSIALHARVDLAFTLRHSYVHRSGVGSTSHLSEPHHTMQSANQRVSEDSLACETNTSVLSCVSV